MDRVIYTRSQAAAMQDDPKVYGELMMLMYRDSSDAVAADSVLEQLIHGGTSAGAR